MVGAIERLRYRPRCDSLPFGALPTLVGFEGTWPEGRIVLIEFGSMEQANGWYHSPECQRIAEVRWNNAESTVAFLRGFELPG